LLRDGGLSPNKLIFRGCVVCLGDLFVVICLCSDKNRAW
jgi:hypothetical protein